MYPINDFNLTSLASDQRERVAEQWKRAAAPKRRRTRLHVTRRHEETSVS